jgi:hypothetical protein
MIAMAGTSLAAHDMWIEPTTFGPEPGAIVGLKLRVGQDLAGDPLPRDPALIDRFVVEDADGRKPVVGRDGRDPAGFFRAAMPGLLVVGYQSNPSTVALSPEKLDQYLAEEGLESIAALRARRGQRGSARDRFSRCAKSLLLASPADASGPPPPAKAVAGDRRLGFTLELVAERSPMVMNAGQELPVTLTYQDHPLAGALVVAINRDHPAEKVSARSDRDGRVRLRLSHDGMWLVKAVHMIEAPAGSDADWVSYWASLTFEIGAAQRASR